MSTLVRIFIFVGEVLILFLYEFIHIRKEIKKRQQWEENVNKGKKTIEKWKEKYWLHEPRKYRFTAIISYSILNIIIMLLPLLIYSNERAFSYNKLILWGLGIVGFIYVQISFLSDEYSTTLRNFLMLLLFGIPLFILIFVSLFSDFSEVLNIKETSCEIIQEKAQINCIIKYYKNKSNNYIIYYTDEKGERKEKIIEEKDVKSLEYTDTISIKKFTTEYIKINPELRNPEKYTETSSVYYISIPKELVYNLTN